MPVSDRNPLFSLVIYSGAPHWQNRARHAVDSIHGDPSMKILFDSWSKLILYLFGDPYRNLFWTDVEC